MNFNLVGLHNNYTIIMDDLSDCGLLLKKTSIHVHVITVSGKTNHLALLMILR